MIAKLSKLMASFFIQNKIIECKDREVYEYSLQLLLSTVFNGIIALVFAVISRTLLPCICYLTTFVLFRKAAGGFHAKTHFGCCAILMVVLSLFITFIKLASTDVYLITSVIAISFSVIMILIFAPVEHENKPIGEKDKIRLRRISFAYTVFFPLFIFVLFMANMKVTMVSIALGMFTSSSSILAAVISRNLKSLHLGT